MLKISSCTSSALFQVTLLPHDKKDDTAMSAPSPLAPSRVDTLNEPMFGSETVADTDTAEGLFTLLRNRMGWTEEFLASIEDPTHPPLRDLDEIVKALHWVKQNNKKIVVLPDFDMDGISSGVLGYAGLAELGLDVELYVPDYNRGHDIMPEAIDELVARHPGVDVIITCDGGVNSHAGIRHGRDQGLIMLVTDHHVQLPTESDGTVVPSAHVTIDPERIDETYPHPGICGAFVLYQVIMAYAHAHAPEREGDISLLKLFAGLGTVSDVMPLKFENRQLVRDSLSLARMLVHNLPSADLVTPYDIHQSILISLLDRQGRHSPAFLRAFYGFALTLRAWREAGSLRSTADLRSDFYGFYVAPAFNALRRVGAPLHLAFDVFTAPTEEEQYRAAQRILQCNEERKEQVQHWMADIENRDQPLAPFVWLSDAPAGMLGLLAGRLLQENGVPTIVVRDPGNPKVHHGGSARAPMWFDVIATLTTQGFTAVGHEQACGVRARSFTELAEIAELIKETTAVLQAQLALLQVGPDAKPEYDLAVGVTALGRTKPDGALPSAEAMLEIASRVEGLAPFGHGFDRPRIRFIANLSLCSMGVLGSEETHLKLVLPNGLKLLWWNAAEHLPELRELAESPIPGENIVEFDADLSINRFMGEESPQAVVERAILPGEA